MTQTDRWRCAHFLKWENEAQMAKILRKAYENHRPQFPKLSVVMGQKSILHYCIQYVKDGIQFHVYEIKKESVSHLQPVYFSKS